MDTYYIRHTKKLGIDESTRQKLWRKQRIAIHFPRYKDGKIHKRDNMSLNLADYDSRGRRAMHALTALAKDGGYVCAEYYQHAECVVGYVKPASTIKLYRGRWGSETKYDGREAILKTLRLKKVKTINRSKSTVFLVGRPRQGTIMRWKNTRKTIENIVEGRKKLPSLSDLSYSQQEIMCSEFLRSEKARQVGFAKLLNLLLPVGRTMRGIDICGISESGMVFAQVTYHPFDRCHAKLETLRQYRGSDRDSLVLFCCCDRSRYQDGVRIFPLGTVYKLFVATPTGKRWLKKATS